MNAITGRTRCATDEIPDTTAARPRRAAVHHRGSVDDGKSTLIGRLLYDTKRHPRGPARGGRAPRASAVSTVSTCRCSPTACAPSASRASPSTSPTAISPRAAQVHHRRHPGHEQYTRNMVTGASTADLAVILVDARKG
jgi:translation initiation factor 2 gamma subunit (eIF-2gamma)